MNAMFLTSFKIFIVFVLYAFCRLGVFAVCNPLKVCPKSPDDSVNVPTLTPKKLIAYKRGMVLKKAAALAAFQQVATDDTDEMILESSVPAIAEEDEDEGGAGASSLRDDGDFVTSHGVGDAHQLQTMAEVLPVRENVLDTFSQRADDDDDDALASSVVDRFRRKRRKPFMAFGDNNGDDDDDDADDDFDTNTVINDLFGEELERMDQERLAAKYDVLNLEDIGIEYDEDKWAPANDSATSETRLTSPPRTKTASFNVSSLRKKSAGSNFSSWDDFDTGSSFDGSTKGKMPLKSSASSARKAVLRRQKDTDDDEF